MKLRPWLIGIVVGLGIFAWSRIWSHLRDSLFAHGITAQSERAWWTVAISLYGALFVATAIFITIFLRRTQRRVERFLILTSVANAFVVWGVFALSAITSDVISRPALSSVGLASLSGWLFGVGCCWSLFSLYILFRTIDHSPRTP
jgi:hypothetical protein